MLKILKEPKSTKLLNNFFFRKNKELIIIELLKLFFLIASIIVFLETTAKAQATLTSDISIRPLASFTTDSEGDQIVNDAFQDPTGLAFSNDGRKVFVSNRYLNNAHKCLKMMTLSTPYDLRTASLVVDQADPLVSKVGLTDVSNDTKCTDIKFSKDGLKLFLGNITGKIHGFELAKPFDLTGLTYSNNVTSDLGGDATFSFSNDGKKLIYLDGTREGQHIDEYSLSTAYDLTSITLVNTTDLRTTANVSSGKDYGWAVEFSQDGMTMFVLILDDTNNNNTSLDTVFQFSLTTSFSTSTATMIGSVTLPEELSLRTFGIAFSGMGDKLYIVNDLGPKVAGTGADVVTQVSLSCNYGLVACVSDPRSSLGTQVQLAKNNISMNTSIIFKRFEWIKRNRNSNNLNNFTASIKSDNPLLNYWVKKFPDKLLSVNEKVEDGQSITIGLKDINNNKLNNFTTAIKSDNPLLNSWMDKLPEKITARKASAKKKTEDKQQDIFYWSEGSIAVGRVGDTNISSFKKIRTEAITLGADKFTDNNGIKGLAFRIGNNNVDVGMGESNIDTDTFNLSYYSTTPLENDTKSEDIVIGFGKLKYNILTVLDGKHIKASRDGRQVYFTNKFKDEIKKDNFILIPSFQADVGHTILDGYTESGIGAIKVKDQNIQTLKLRTAMGVVDDLPNESTFCPGVKNKTCFIKRHGKLEYMADLSRSSNFKYTYASDQTLEFNEKLYSGALHNVNGEVGIDIILPDSLSVFLIYERNQALGSGYTDNINITIGYLPNKKTNYAFKVAGSDNLGSEYKISKNINDFEIDFKLNNQDVLKPNTIDEAMVSLNRIF